MAEQKNIFEVDHTGRKSAKLGLSHDHELVVEIMDEARRLHAALTRYQIGIADCEMKQLSNADRSTELTRLWNDTFTSYSSLGSLLARWNPIDDAIEADIRTEASVEKQKSEEAAKLGLKDTKPFLGGFTGLTIESPGERRG